MKPIEQQLLQLGEHWCDVDGRTLTTLGRLMENDGKFFSRVARGSISLTIFNRCLSFFRDGANWPDGRIPEAATAILDNFENIATDAAASIGQADDVSDGDSCPSRRGASPSTSSGIRSAPQDERALSDAPEGAA